MLLRCCHVIHVAGEVLPTMCHIRWHKSYMFHYGKNEQITSAMRELATDVPIGVPIAGTKFLQRTLNESVSASLCPQRPNGVSEGNYLLLTKLLADTEYLVSSSNENSNDDLSMSQEVDFTLTDKAGVCQEVIFSPRRVLMSDTLSSDNPSYRDCLKVFNFVFSHSQSSKSGTKNLISSLWGHYNELVRLTTDAPNRNSIVVSFPEVMKSSKFNRKRSAGFL